MEGISEDLGQLILKIEDSLAKIDLLSREHKPIPKDVIETTRIYALKYKQITGHYYTHEYGNHR